MEKEMEWRRRWKKGGSLVGADFTFVVGAFTCWQVCAFLDKLEALLKLKKMAPFCSLALPFREEMLLIQQIGPKRWPGEREKRNGRH